jgi:hypothetical protein
MKATSVEQLFTSAVQDASNRPIDGRFLPAANRNPLLAYAGQSEVIFCVFDDDTHAIYEALLS